MPGNNDPKRRRQQAAALVADWGSDWCLLGAHEHLNGDSWIGDWDQGHASQKALA